MTTPRAIPSVYISTWCKQVVGATQKAYCTVKGCLASQVASSFASFAACAADIVQHLEVQILLPLTYCHKGSGMVCEIRHLVLTGCSFYCSGQNSGQSIFMHFLRITAYYSTLVVDACRIGQTHSTAEP